MSAQLIFPNKTVRHTLLSSSPTQPACTAHVHRFRQSRIRNLAWTLWSRLARVHLWAPRKEHVRKRRVGGGRQARLRTIL